MKIAEKVLRLLVEQGREDMGKVVEEAKYILSIVEKDDRKVFGAVSRLGLLEVAAKNLIRLIKNPQSYFRIQTQLKKLLGEKQKTIADLDRERKEFGRSLESVFEKLIKASKHEDDKKFYKILQQSVREFEKLFEKYGDI